MKFEHMKGKSHVSQKVNTAWRESVFGVILVRIFPHSVYLPVFSPNMGKCGPEKLHIQTLPRSVKNIKINHNADELMMILNRITIFNVIFFTVTTMFQKFDLCSITLSFWYEQLGPGLSPESCLYLQGFRGSKLLNDFLVVWPSNLCLRGIQ